MFPQNLGCVLYTSASNTRDGTVRSVRLLFSSGEKKNGGTVQEEENLEDIDLTDPELNKAAVKIQASFRGHKTRKQTNPDEDQAEPAEQ